MSFINHYFGGRIREKIPTHSEGCHEVMITDENPPIVIEKSSGVVLSHHYDCVMPEDLASGLKIFALSEDGVVEGLYHPKMKIIGIQWHPEKFDSGWVDNGLIKYISTTDF
jgi:putative glutamine amidotransferase